MAQNEPAHRRSSNSSSTHGSRKQADNFIKYQVGRGITDTRTLYSDLMKRYGATSGVMSVIDKYNLGPDYWGSKSGPGSEETPPPPQVNPNTGVPPGEPAAPAAPPVRAEPGYPVSGTPPGTKTSELTPRQALPAFIPNFNAYWDLNMSGQPSYTDPRWYHRIEDPYPGAIDISSMGISGRGFGGQPTTSPFLPTTSEMGQTGLPSYDPFVDDYSYGWQGPGISNPLALTTRQSPPAQSWYGGLRTPPAAATNPLMGGAFGMNPQGSIGGGMLGMHAKGLSPRAFGGMLSRGYFS